MIQLSRKQLNEADRLMDEVATAQFMKDRLGSAPTFKAFVRGGPGEMCMRDPLGNGVAVEVEVDRALVVVTLNQRRDAALAQLRALGIELAPDAS